MIGLGFELRKFIYITVALFVMTLTLLVGLLDQFTLGWHTAGRVTAAATATVFAWVIIVHWWWKKWPFTSLLRVPILEGTWTGHLESNWVRGADNPERQIPIVFVIRQNLLSLTVISYTNDRHGVSYVAQLVADGAAKTIKLVYLYSLREEFRPGEEAQQGAAGVRIIGERKYEMRGGYWTSTKTHGRLILNHRSQAAVSSFEEAERKWNRTSWLRFQ